MIGATHHGAGSHRGKAQLVGDAGVFAELVRVHKAFHRGVMLARLQVLANGDHVHVVGAQILDGVDDLFKGFAQPHHDAALVLTSGRRAL